MVYDHIKGIFSPVLTSFDKDGAVYNQGCKNILDFELPYVNGFFVCGSYGLGSLMSIDERKHVLELMAGHINGSRPLIVHVGTPATHTTVELAKHAQSVGVDAIAVMPPFFYRHNPENILAHFQAVLDAVDTPVLIYDYPSLSNNPVNLKLLEQLADLGVVGVKYTSSDFPDFLIKMANLPYEKFTFMIGTEALLLAALSHGAQACVTGMANSLPHHLARLYQAILKGNHEQACKLQQTTNKARAIIKRAPGIVSAYALMHYQGINAGYPRLPFLVLKQEDIKSEIKDLEELGLLPEEEIN
jgi:N-acetylneuraminate lyase/4-hydroxy-tetrahydrodipicolinate synthase